MPANESIILLIFAILLLFIFLGLSSSLYMISADVSHKPAIQNAPRPSNPLDSDWMMVFILQRAPGSLWLLGCYQSVLLAILGIIFVLLVDSLRDLTWMNVSMVLCILIFLSNVSSRLVRATVLNLPAQLLPLVELNAVVSIAPIVGIKLLATRLMAFTSKRSLSADQIEEPNKFTQPKDTAEDMTMTVDSLDPKEKRMILGVLDLDSTAVREIMVPRVDLSATDINSTISEI